MLLTSLIASAFAATITINNCANTFPTMDQVGNVTYNCTGSTTVTPPPPLPPPTEIISCAGSPSTVVYNHAWGDTARKYSKNYGNLNDSDTLVIRVVVPTTIPLSNTKKYTLFGAEWQDQGVPRNFKIANKPCEQAGTGFAGKSFGGTFYINDVVVKERFGNLNIFLDQPTFKPGEVIYMNLKNDVGCYGGCNVFWQMSW